MSFKEAFSEKKQRRKEKARDRTAGKNLLTLFFPRISQLKDAVCVFKELVSPTLVTFLILSLHLVFVYSTQSITSVQLL